MAKVWFILFVLLPSHIFAAGFLVYIQDIGPQVQQDQKLEPVSFEDKRLVSYKKQADFDYSRTMQDSWWTRLKKYLQLKWNNLISWLFGELPSNRFFAILIRALPYLILLGILFFFLWLFNRLNPRRMLAQNTHKNRVFLTEEDEIVLAKNINKMIERALNQGDYRSAIRYQYLLVLQILNKQELIDYRSDKTNEDYAKEIASEPLRNAFRKLSGIYDYTWYGSFTATQEIFKKMELGYLRVIQISNTDNEQK